MQSDFNLDMEQEDFMQPSGELMENIFDDNDNEYENEDEGNQQISGSNNIFEVQAQGGDGDEDLYSIQAHKITNYEDGEKDTTKKKNVRKFKRSGDVGGAQGFVPMESENRTDGNDVNEFINEDPDQRRRRLLEEKMDIAIKTKTTRRRKADEDDLERMQDEKIDILKDKMIKAANMDVEKNSQGQIATEKIKLLKEVTDILSKADLAISILDNNLLEAVRLWLEPLPDASMPAYQLQKELISALATLPIKTDHLVASGIGKVLVFYQRSKRTEPNLKKAIDRLIGDWTRPILNKSDSYKDRTIQFHEYNKQKFTNQLASARRFKPKEAKSLYEESAERRNRAAIPSARTTAYKIAPKVDPSLLRRQQLRNNGGNDERFKRLNQKLTLMKSQKKTTKKAGPSIEGRNLAI